MKRIGELTKEFVRRPVVAMPPAISVEEACRAHGFEKVTKMCSNENPLGVSPKAVEAMQDELTKLCYYADPGPENLLRDKIAARVGVERQNVMVTTGAAFALNFIGEVFIQNGDEGILCSPTYPPYYSIIRKSGGVVVDVPVKPDGLLDFDAIRAAITERTKVLFLCNPNNPTSCAIYRDALLAFVDTLPKDVIVVIDEAYVQFSRNPQALTMVPAIKSRENIIVVQTFSKLYGMASIRVGYAVSTPEIIQYLSRCSIARSLNAVGIRGAIAALDDAAFEQATIACNNEGREYLTKELRALGFFVYPSESNFVYADVEMDVKEVTNRLLCYGIIIRGDFPLLRISIGTMEQNVRLIEALGEITGRRAHREAEMVRA